MTSSNERGGRMLQTYLKPEEPMIYCNLVPVSEEMRRDLELILCAAATK
jgi:hypothetical protein